MIFSFSLFDYNRIISSHLPSYKTLHSSFAIRSFASLIFLNVYFQFLNTKKIRIPDANLFGVSKSNFAHKNMWP